MSTVEVLFDAGADAMAASSERAVIVRSKHGALFGIFTPAAADAPASGRCVVWFTRPRSHRNRMWVDAARRLARAGFASFRFDYHGVGDSEGDVAFLDPSAPYCDDARAVIEHLQQALGQRRFVLVGHCFDACTALSLMPDHSALIDGVLFIAAPVMTPADFERAVFEPERAGDLPLSQSFVQAFRALVASRARAWFLYGQEDHEYVTFAVAEQRLFATLPVADRARVRVGVWPGKIHGFLELQRQREVLAAAMDWVESFHPGRITREPRLSAASVRES